MLIYLELLATPEEQDKFQALYERYYGLLLHIANQILHNHHDAEDATQEAFLAVVKNLEKISEVGCPKTRAFLVTIVERKAIDLYRKRKQLPLDPLEEDQAGVTIPYDGDDGVTRCMLQLSARYREWLILRYDQGYTVEELAEVFDLSMDAAYKLQERAKKRLEEICIKEWIL